MKEIPKRKRAKTKVKEVMTPKEKLISVKPDEPAVDALIKLSNHDVGRLPVLKEDKLVGILTGSDVLKAIRPRSEL